MVLYPKTRQQCVSCMIDCAVVQTSKFDAKKIGGGEGDEARYLDVYVYALSGQLWRVPKISFSDTK